MTEPETPDPPAPAFQPPPLPPRLEIEEVSQTERKWILELHPDHIALHSEFEPRPWVFTRGELWDKCPWRLEQVVAAVQRVAAAPGLLGRQMVHSLRTNEGSGKPPATGAEHLIAQEPRPGP